MTNIVPAQVAVGAVSLLFLSYAPARGAVLAVETRPMAGVRLPERFKIEADCTAGPRSGHQSYRVGRPAEVGEVEVFPAVWRVVVRGEGFWTAEHVVTVEDNSERRPLVFEAWPVGRLAGRAEPASGEPAAWIEVHFQVARDVEGPRIPPGQVRCPVVDGAWSCVVPGGVLDVELRSDRSDVRDRRRIQVPAGSRVDVGVVAPGPPQGR